MQRMENIQKKKVYIQVYTLYQGISFYDKDPELESHNSYYRKNNGYTRLNLRRKKRPDNLTKITIKTGAGAATLRTQERPE